MQQDVEKQLARRHYPRLFTYLEGAYLVRHVFVELLHELLQLTPDRGAVVEERRHVVPGQAGGGVDGLASQPLQVSALDDEDVIDQLSDRAETIVLLKGHFESRGAVGEEAAPLGALFLRIAEQLLERECERHYFIAGAPCTPAGSLHSLSLRSGCSDSLSVSMFSSRLPRDLSPNTLALRVAAHRAARRPLVDLTVTNPTTVGIPYPEGILASLANRNGFEYRPEPFGLASARAAVSRDYARRGTTVAPDRIVLTASTSEAYSILFKLLCDPQDDVLVPAPSYPLFEHLSHLDGVTAAAYRLEYHGQWMVDEHSVDSGWTENTRAVLAVSPNNPTGSWLSHEDELMLSGRCAERNAAMIVDEVFADYPLAPLAPSAPVAPSAPLDPPLSFRLGGLSKSAGLPQLKLGWIAVSGPESLVAEALHRLEIICDTYLSVSTPVQVAAPELIEQGATVRAAILQRIRRNYSELTKATLSHGCIELLHADGGWSAVLRIPSTISEEQVVLTLLEEDNVLVHPGYFFDFPHEAFLIVSLLPAPADFDEGVRRIMTRLHG